MLRKKRQHQRKETKADNPNSPHEPGPLYDDMEERPGYQELGEVSKPSTYDTLTQWDSMKKTLEHYVIKKIKSQNYMFQNYSDFPN